MNLSNSLVNYHFSDDTTGLCRGHDFHDPVLQNIGTWLRSHKLAINANKTKIVVFHTKGKHIPDIEFVFNNNDFGVPENPDLINPIEQVKNYSGL